MGQDAQQEPGALRSHPPGLGDRTDCPSLTISNFKSVSEKPLWSLHVLLLEDLLIFQGRPCVVTRGNCIRSWEVYKHKGQVLGLCSLVVAAPARAATLGGFAFSNRDPGEGASETTRHCYRSQGIFTGLSEVTVSPLIHSSSRENQYKKH